jgi:hypothetical protein
MSASNLSRRAKSTVRKKLRPKNPDFPVTDEQFMSPLSHMDLLRSASSKVAHIKIPTQGVKATRPQTLARAPTFFINLLVKIILRFLMISCWKSLLINVRKLTLFEERKGKRNR